jgi:SAM-dependent methyltransferase
MNVNASCILRDMTVAIDGIERDVYELGAFHVLPSGDGLGNLILQWAEGRAKEDGKYCVVGLSLPETYEGFYKKYGWSDCGEYSGRVVMASVPAKEIKPTVSWSLDMNEIKRAREALRLFLTLPIEGKVLDIGSSDSSHSTYMRYQGMDVTTLDHNHAADINAVWPIKMDPKFGAVWCSHILEHSRNTGVFLDAIADALEPGGWLAISVPPAKHEIVGGHLSIWNAGLLLYNLILAGFDCRDAKVYSYDYNISVIVKYKKAILPKLFYDCGDIELLQAFFPFPVYQGFNGIIHQVNWNSE